MSEPYLKPKQYYSDLYDKRTVEECRWWINHPDDPKDIKKQSKKQKLAEQQTKGLTKLVGEFSVHFIAGERYIKKEETLREWMSRDEERDRLLETATAPEDITCLTCGRLMFVSSKSLDFTGDGPERVMFFYDCHLNHLPRRAFFHDGEEWKRKKHLCPKCKNELTEKNTKKGNKILTKESCAKCGYSQDHVMDLGSKKPKKEKLDKNFAKDRERFCLSDEEGQKYIQEKRNMEELAKVIDKIKEKESNHLYERRHKASH